MLKRPGELGEAPLRLFLTGATRRPPQPCDCIGRTSKMPSGTRGMIISRARSGECSGRRNAWKLALQWEQTLSQRWSWLFVLSHRFEQRQQACFNCWASFSKYHPAPLLVFVDCFVLLNILQQWGNFNPEQKDIVHFDVILPLLVALRQWPLPVRLVEKKSHTGCLLNERADEHEDAAQEVCPSPQKFGSLALRTRQHVRELAQECKKALPRDSAPNHSIPKRAVGANTRRAACMSSTFFVRQLLHQKEGETIARVVSRCHEAEYRVWVKGITGP
jgi:hypothetical protein